MDSPNVRSTKGWNLSIKYPELKINAFEICFLVSITKAVFKADVNATIDSIALAANPFLTPLDLLLALWFSGTPELPQLSSVLCSAYRREPFLGEHCSPVVRALSCEPGLKERLSLGDGYVVLDLIDYYFLAFQSGSCVYTSGDQKLFLFFKVIFSWNSGFDVNTLNVSCSIVQSAAFLFLQSTLGRLCHSPVT